jgi:hypothetical protein
MLSNQPIRTVVHAKIGLTARPNMRCATSSIEVFVGLTLLTTVLSLSAPLIVRHGRMLIAHRHYRIALDELTNQLDRLTALPADEVAAAVGKLSPSEFASTRLPGVKLQSRLKSADIGQRVILTITWDEPERHKAPVSLAAWIVAASLPPDEKPQVEEEQ